MFASSRESSLDVEEDEEESAGDREGFLVEDEYRGEVRDAGGAGVDDGEKLRRYRP